MSEQVSDQTRKQIFEDTFRRKIDLRRMTSVCSGDRKLSEIVNASYAQTKDIRKTMRETGVSFSEVREMVGLKDYFDFEVTGED